MKSNKIKVTKRKRSPHHHIKCPLCGRTFSQEWTKNRHIRVLHFGGTLPKIMKKKESSSEHL